MAQIDPNKQIIQKLDDLSTEVKALRTDTHSMKSDVSLSYLRLDQIEKMNKAMQSDISDLKTDVRRLEVLHEEMDGKIDQVLEMAVPSSKEIPLIREHNIQTDDKLLFHERRIGLLEKKLA